MRRAIGLLPATLALIGVALAAGCRRKPTESPGTAGGADPAPWTAFQGGGSLHGRAGALAPGRLALRWEYRIGEGSRSSAAIVGGTVYIGGADDAVYALDLASGRLRWKHETEAEVQTTPLVFEGRLFAGDLAGVLHALSAEDGKPLWTFKAGAEIKSSANRSGANVLFGSYDNVLYCVLAETGEEVWRFQTSAPVHATPAVVEGLTFCGGCDAALRAIDAATGEEKWSAEMGAPVPTAPVGFEGKVAAGNLEGEAACFSLADGKELWRSKFEDEALFAAFAFADGLLVVPGRRKALYCLDAGTGELRWTRPSRSGFEAPAVIAGDRVYAPGKDGRLHVLALATGEEVSSFSAGAGIEGAPAIGEGAVVFCDTSGVVYCLAPSG